MGGYVTNGKNTHVTVNNCAIKLLPENTDKYSFSVLVLEDVHGEKLRPKRSCSRKEFKPNSMHKMVVCLLPQHCRVLIQNQLSRKTTNARAGPKQNQSFAIHVFNLLVI